MNRIILGVGFLLILTYSNLIYGISVDWFGVQASSYLAYVMLLGVLGLLFLTVGFVSLIKTEPPVRHFDTFFVQEFNDENVKVYEQYRLNVNS